jgi:hypothetical protein
MMLGHVDWSAFAAAYAGVAGDCLHLGGAVLVAAITATLSFKGVNYVLRVVGNVLDDGVVRNYSFGAEERTDEEWDRDHPGDGG